MYIDIQIKKIILFTFGIIFCICVLTSLIVKSAVASNCEDGINLPIIMYHGVLKDEHRTGKYVITPKEFEGDLKYLKENNYTTVVMKDLIDYVYNEKELPQNPVMLTFDDGYYNNYLYAFPLLKEYDCKMVLSPIGKYTDLYSQNEDINATYSHVTWNNINEMIATGLVEIQNHSYDMHTNKNRNGTKKKKNESLDEYKKIFTQDVMKMQKQITDNTCIEPTTFTYPFGAISNASIDILKEMGFKATLTCAQKTNVITKNPECLFGLNRFLRPGNVESKDYFENRVKIKNT